MRGAGGARPTSEKGPLGPERPEPGGGTSGEGGGGAVGGAGKSGLPGARLGEARTPEAGVGRRLAGACAGGFRDLRAWAQAPLPVAGREFRPRWDTASPFRASRAGPWGRLLGWARVRTLAGASWAAGPRPPLPRLLGRL